MADVQRADIAWRKSAASAQGDCVEIAFVGEQVLLRHSKKPDGPVIAFSRQEWGAFLVGVREGTFDLT